ncbi:hypothetical protein [Globicatella sulfidifaciens]|uniref:Uncharacterized protein n=1 Tax=Globicatella sulfidifaciens TaxID=136093 RepID=A0A7X8H0Y2_9LACT|nr:hypothetical protein [Globicatella sulfidifaciens]NLJ19319.1 hypothetical protein [Globicatella sulfidifaciens]
MSRLKHEEGATLIIVLLVLVIFSISVSLLSFQINNMSAQFKKTEAVIEAKHLADMGEEYYKAYVNKTVQDAPNPVNLAFLNDKFKSPEEDPGVTIDSDSGSSFKIMPTYPNISQDGDTFTIEYKIQGTVGTEVAENIFEIKIEIW